MEVTFVVVQILLFPEALPNHIWRYSELKNILWELIEA